MEHQRQRLDHRGVRQLPGQQAFRWTAGGGVQGLGDLPGGAFSSSARGGTSYDGSIVAGESESASGTEAFRWTAAGGMQALGDLPGGTFSSSAHGISADGSIIVGGSQSYSGQEAFRWTAGGGMQGLGDLPGNGFLSSAMAISADGSVIVGYGTSDPGIQACRWTGGGAIEPLGDLPGGDFYSEAFAVSGDGSLIVGMGSTAAGAAEEEAFLWDSAHGMRRLANVLTYDLGLDLSGWTLSEANGISPDGSVVVGDGYDPTGNQEAWMAVIPEPSTVTMMASLFFGLWGRRPQRHGT